MVDQIINLRILGPKNAFTYFMLNQIKFLLHTLGFASIIDKGRYLYFKIVNKKINKQFRLLHPELPIPPDKFLYETYRLDYRVYFENIDLIAKEITSITLPYLNSKKPRITILDWGCGLGGNSHGLKMLLKDNALVFGCDINSEMIEWNQKHLNNIDFSTINPTPPTHFPAEYFDLVFGISIFTHLNKESHFLWITELHRILNKNGILLFTTHGSAFKSNLTKKELGEYNKGHFVERNYSKEGLRVFSSFQPPPFIQNLVKSGFEIINHYDGAEFPELIGNQDKWVLRKLG